MHKIGMKTMPINTIVLLQEYYADVILKKSVAKLWEFPYFHRNRTKRCRGKLVLP